MKLNIRVVITALSAVLVVGSADLTHAISNESATVIREAGAKAATVLQTEKGASILKAVAGTELASAVAQYLGVDKFDANNPIQVMTLQSRLANDESALSYAISKDILSINSATGSTVEVAAISAKIADLKLASVSAVKAESTRSFAPQASGVAQAALAAQFARKLKENGVSMGGDITGALDRLLSSKLWSAVEGVHADLCLAGSTDFTNPAVLEKITIALASMEPFIDQYSQNNSGAMAARNAFHASLVNQGVSIEGSCKGTQDRANGCEIVQESEACSLLN
ncbi:hypothetical protein GW915_08120 [bacterium]|nr:hypothetical protein [bacterium]